MVDSGKGLTTNRPPSILKGLNTGQYRENFMKILLLALTIALTGCVGGGSTTILKGVDVNDGRPGTYSGYTYVPKTYSPQKRSK